MEPSWGQQHAGVLVFGFLGLVTLLLVPLVVWLNRREKRRQRDAELAVVADAPLRGATLNPMRGFALGAIAGALFAATMTTIHGQWGEPKQLLGLLLFSAVGGALGRILSFIPIRRGTLRLDKAAGALEALIGTQTLSLDLNRAFTLERFNVAPSLRSLPYTVGLSGAVIGQGSIEIRVAWPLTILDKFEHYPLARVEDTWVTDRRGLAICQHLDALPKQ
jgi:hypothetical protein